MRDVAQIRAYVWGFLDLEEEDMPAALIDTWILEGWRKIVRTTRRWPHFEHEWSVVTTPGVREIALDTEIDEIDAIEGPWGNLTYEGEAVARHDYNTYNGVPTSGRPERFTLHAGVLRIYPTPDAEYTLRILGWRQPEGDWMQAGTGAVPDIPEDLEDALLSWVMHRAYTHQDDPELSELEKVRFEEAINEMVSHHIQGPLAQPMVLGGGRRKGFGPWGERPIPWGTDTPSVG